MEVHILSGGAAQGVVRGLEQSFLDETGARLQATFGAVGMMKEKLLGGAPCDVLILTQALIDELEQTGRVEPGSAAPLGRVKTGVAVKAGEAQPDVSTADGLRAALLAARGIYFPDPQKATAGIHFINVVKKLGILNEVEAALRPFPNGATAMAQMAAANEPGLLGCTQVTEILYTPGVTLVAPLPVEFELATIYTAALSTRADQPELGRRLIAALSGDASKALREQGGFEL
ncbi:MAG: ABC transporter substrate-binding protein [Oxalobacteraceae bacterium]|nr:MAG: ABC transporter substrate-binding protein [Oxalobacteraceae bacterium]